MHIKVLPRGKVRNLINLLSTHLQPGKGGYIIKTNCASRLMFLRRQYSEHQFDMNGNGHCVLSLCTMVLDGTSSNTNLRKVAYQMENF